MKTMFQSAEVCKCSIRNGLVPLLSSRLGHWAASVRIVFPAQGTTPEAPAFSLSPKWHIHVILLCVLLNLAGMEAAKREAAKSLQVPMCTKSKIEIQDLKKESWTRYWTRSSQALDHSQILPFVHVVLSHIGLRFDEVMRRTAAATASPQEMIVVECGAFLICKLSEPISTFYMINP